MLRGAGLVQAHLCLTGGDGGGGGALVGGDDGGDGDLAALDRGNDEAVHGAQGCQGVLAVHRGQVDLWWVGTLWAQVRFSRAVAIGSFRPSAYLGDAVLGGSGVHLQLELVSI